MAIFKQRLVSREKVIYAFAAVVFITHVWGLINMFNVIPSWLLRLDIWNLVSVIAYTQVFVLLESLLILLVLVLLGFLLPGRWFRNRFLSLSTAFVFLSALWAILFHYNSGIFLSGGAFRLLGLAGLYFLTILAAFILIYKSPRAEAAIDSFVYRISMLSFIYVFVDLVGVLIVISRSL